MGTNVVQYDITPMINGWYRAECLVARSRGDWCGFHTDHSKYGDAYLSLRNHMRTHRITINLPRSERAVP